MGITNKDGALYFATGVDNTGLYKGLDRAENRIHGYKESVNKAGLAVGSLFAIHGASDFIKQIVNVRGEFQQLEIAFSTMLKSEEKAMTLMSQLTDFAARTPFGLQSASTGAKQLIAYGSAAEDVIEELTMLGDVAAGTGQTIGDLVYLYGTLRMQGRAYAVDIRQFAGRGIPIYEELAKVLKINKDHVNEFVTAGKVGFKEVEQAFKNMSSSGGLYGGLMEAQSKAIKGQIETLKDNFQVMLNEIGEQSEGVIGESIEGAALLVENYEKVGKILVGLIATYGTYRTALMLTAATSKGYTVAQMTQLNILIAVEKAQKLLNATILKNPYVLAATLIMGVVAAMWALHDSTTAAEKAQKNFADKNQEMVDASEKRKESAKELINIIQDESQAETDRLKAYNQLIKLYPTLFKDIDIEKIKITELTSLVKSLNEEESKRFGKIKQDQLNNLYAQRDALNRNIESLGQSPNGNRKIRKKEAEENLKIVESQIKALEDEKKAFLELQLQSGNKAVASIYGVDYKETQKEWQEAKKALEAIEKDKDKFTTKQYNDAKEREKMAKEAFENLGGVTKVNTKATTDANKLKSETADRLREIEEMKIKIAASEKDAEFDLQQQRINLMEEGADKTLAQINLNYDKRENEIMRRGEELLKIQQDMEQKVWEAENPNWEKKGMDFTPSTTKISDLPSEMTNYLAGLFQANTAMRDKNEAEHLNSLLEKYQGYIEKRKTLDEKYERERKDLEKSGASDESLAEFDYQREEALKAIDEQFAMREDTFQAWANEVVNLSIKDLRLLIDQTKAELDKMEKDNPSNPALATTRAKVSTAEKELSKKEANTSPEKRSIKEWEDLYRVLGKTSKQFEEIGDEVGGLAGDIISTAGVVASSTMQMVDGIITVAKGGSSAIQGTAIAASSAIKAVEKASVILAIIGAALQIATKIAGMFGPDNSNYEEAKENYTSYLSVLDQIIAKQHELIETMTGKAAVEASERAIELLNKQAEAARELGKLHMNTNSSNTTHSYGYRNWEKFSSKEWKDLYNLDEELYKIISGDKESKMQSLLGMDDKFLRLFWSGDKRMSGLFDLTSEQLIKLKEELPTFWGKLDDDVQDYLEQIIKSNEEIGKTKEVLHETLTGVDFDSFRDGFLDALLDMDSTAEDFADNVGEYLQKAIMNSMMVKNFDGRIRNLYEKFSEYSESDEKIDQAEYEDLMRMRDQMVEDMIKERDQLKELFKWESESDNDNKDLEASSRTLQGVTQDTASELLGQARALRMDIAEMVMYFRNRGDDLSSITSGVAGISSIIEEHKNILLLQLQEQMEIKRNTARAAVLLDHMIDVGLKIKEGKE